MEFWLTATVVVMTVAVALIVARAPDRPPRSTGPPPTQTPGAVVRPPVPSPEFHNQRPSGAAVLRALMATIARDEPVEPAHVPNDARGGAVAVGGGAPALAKCERCEASVGVPLEAWVSYCLGCRLYLCARCRTPDTPRCVECGAMTRSSRRGRTAGIVAARDAMSVLHQGILELSQIAVTDAASRSTRRDAAAHKMGASDPSLVEIKIQAAAAAADHALHKTPARHQRKARALRDELTLLLVRANAVRDDVAHLAASAHSPDDR